MALKKPSQLAQKSKAAADRQVQNRGPIVRRQSLQPAAETADVAQPEVPREDAHGVICVCPTGDVVLDVQSGHDGERVSFRASSRSLVARSAYFTRLLQDTRFAEGAAVAVTLQKLREQYVDPADAPSVQLPRIEIAELGRTSAIKSIRPLLTDFLLVLHNGELATRKVPLTNLTNLAVVADRFDAVDPIADWVRTRGVLVRPKALASPASEETLRQRLLIGVLLRDSELVQAHSRDLILKGSPLWDEPDRPAPSDALWWDLPTGIEEELQHRRNAVLRTLWSLVRACLDAYSRPGARQCRLGYDSSPQCDSFQLGEFARFLVRAGYMSFASALAPDAAPQPAPRDRDVPGMLAALRACPSYQLDAHHSHCGPRKTLVAGLAAVEALLADADLGVCLACWANPRHAERSWADARPALLFDVARMPRAGPRAREPPHVHAGEAPGPVGSAAGLAREVFTAAEHSWSSPVDGNGLPMRGEWSSVSKMANA